MTAATEVRTRKLAAVVFTDVVGYSAMMQADEEATIPRVRADLAQMRAVCANRGGTCLGTMGDGLMLTFPSAVEAVGFALEVQEAFALRNRNARSDEIVQHRIGVHVGDVFDTVDGIAGDGVNIASRLESSAPVGGVCISQTVYELVKRKLKLNAAFVGEQRFKNIADPLPVWHLLPPDCDASPAASAPRLDARRKIAWPSRRHLIGVALVGGGVCGFAWYFGRSVFPSPKTGSKSLAVLPFVNLSDEKDASFFADGVHEDIITQLALLGNLRVVSRTSVMEYRDTVKRLPQIGSELRVTAIVEGSVRKAGNMVRVTAQLVDVQTERHIWAATYDRDIRDIFKVQSELAKEVANLLNVTLTAEEEIRLLHAPTHDARAYEAYLRYQQLVRDTAGTYRSITSANERLRLLQTAVDSDPNFAIAWAKLAVERARGVENGVISNREDQAALAVQSMAKAKAIAAEDLRIKIDDAAFHLLALKDRVAAEHLYKEVLVKAPYNVDAMMGLSEVFGAQMRDKEIIPLLERGLAVDRRHTRMITFLSGTYGQFRHYDRTQELRHELLDMRADDIDRAAGYIWWTYRASGHWDEYDRWRPTLPKDAEQRSARVRNIDAERATARGDFAEVHRLTDVDSEDWRRDVGRKDVAQAQRLSIHALISRASGDTSNAAALAREALSYVDAVLAQDPSDPSSWGGKARLHALLGDRMNALQTLERAVQCESRYSNEWGAEYRRREHAHILALLGETDAAVNAIERQSKLVGFHINDVRTALEFSSVWTHSRFTDLLARPGTNAPLSFDAPSRYT